MECSFCHNKFSNKQNLNYHQNKAKYCLKIQGKTPENVSTCNMCDKNFMSNITLRRHQKTCKTSDFVEKLKKDFRILKEKYIASESKNKMLMNQVEQYREDFNKLSLTAVKRPVSNTKNVQINNYIQQMAPLTIQDIKESVPMLTLDHHVKGAEGYAEYALEFPFKDKIVCVDVGRNKIKYKNGEGDVIEDIGFRKMMTKLCESLKDRTFNLCQEHYEKLSAKFTEKEMNEYNCMDTALAITRYASGRESEFCNKVIKLISKKSKR
jgi:hypothetical protein